MTSAIDPTVPVFGSPTTASVRNNFLIAKNEITALQNAVAITLPLPVASGGTGSTTATGALTALGAVPLAGGVTMTGLLTLSGPPTGNFGAATKAYVDGFFPVSVSNGGTGANNATNALANLGGATTASPAFTGIPTAPTAPTGDSSTIIATTAFVHNVIASMPVPITAVNSGTGITVNTAGGVATVNLTVPVSIANGGTGATNAVAALGSLGAAPLASPVFTGVPAAPTPAPGTNTTQLATTAFVVAALGAGSGVTSLTGANGGGILVNGSTGVAAGGAVTVSLFAPVSIANGGTGSTTSNGAFDSLLGGISSGSGFITRQSGGSYTLTPATVTPVNRSLIINASNAISTSAIMTDNGTTVGVLPAGNVVIGTAMTAPANTLTINANTVAPPGGLSGNAYVVGADGTTPVIVVDAFGTNFGANFSGRRARGTAAVPAAVQNGDGLVGLNAYGRGATSYSQQGVISYAASENWTDSARGTNLYMSSTPAGSTSAVNTLVLAGNLATITNQLTVNTLPAGWYPQNTPGDFGAGCMAAGGGAQNGYIASTNWGSLEITASNNGAYLDLNRVGGTYAAPTALGNNQQLGAVDYTGTYNTTIGTNYTGVQIVASTNENWSATNRGSNIVLATTPNGTNSRVNSLTLAGNTATFSGTVTTGGIVTVNGSGYNVNAGAADSTVNLASTAHTYTIINQQSSGSFLIYDSNAPAIRLQIASNGNCAAWTSWAVLSDVSVKTDITDHPHGLAEILQLQPRHYLRDGIPASGLIAQELEAVMPELVGEMATADGGTVKTVTEAGVIWPLINAVKELKAELDAMKGAKPTQPSATTTTATVSRTTTPTPSKPGDKK